MSGHLVVAARGVAAAHGAVGGQPPGGRAWARGPPGPPYLPPLPPHIAFTRPSSCDPVSAASGVQGAGGTQGAPRTRAGPMLATQGGCGGQGEGAWQLVSRDNGVGVLVSVLLH